MTLPRLRARRIAVGTAWALYVLVSVAVAAIILLDRTPEMSTDTPRPRWYIRSPLGEWWTDTEPLAGNAGIVIDGRIWIGGNVVVEDTRAESGPRAVGGVWISGGD